ncbi:MAG TPA: hypothetical protein HA230_00735 [Candidatus Aenigmarchaeota archaeon]|nr:hypothetical protein [Candidatus Aenigmarchaeota archaeon]
MSSKNFQHYKRMQDRFNLPHLNELKERFKFDIEENEKIFDQIRNEISERLFTFTEKIIEPVIAGSDSYSCIFEQEMLTEKDRQKLFDIYKKIQVLKWENSLLMLQPDEKKAAVWVKKTWELWNSEIEGELSKTCRKLSNSWKDLRFKTEHSNYND